MTDGWRDVQIDKRRTVLATVISSLDKHISHR